jgi:PAS domain S-box-containing protein
MKPTTDDRRVLRADAEARLARAPPAPTHQEASRLLHELQVHKVELDIQNEDLRMAQVALEEAHARQVDLYDFAPVGYLTVDAAGLVAEANLTAAGMLNVDRRSLVGKRFGLFVGGDSATWRRFLHEVARSSDSRSLDMPIQRGDGSVFDGHLICQHRADGAVGGSVRVVLSDVSEQRSLEEKLGESRKAEDAMAVSEAKFRGLFESMMDGVVVVEMAGTIVESNETFRKMLGYGADELRNLTYTQITPEPWHAMEARIVAEQILPRGHSDVYEKEYRRKDGTIFPVELRTFLLRENGLPSAMWAIVRDVTKVRALQAQVALASRVAAMGTLVAGVAHEINNPLAAELADQGLAIEIAREVRGRLVGGDPLDLPSEARLLAQAVEALEEAQESGDRIARIVKGLATFGSSSPRRSRVQLREVVAEALRWIPSPLARSAVVRVEDGGAPDVVASAGQLEQVVVNLVSNGARAIPEGKRGLVIVRTGPGSPGMARLEVVDDGTGIHPAIRERIFEPFFTTRQAGEGKGMGLGLAICHSIVTAHGGTISVESEVGKGSTFRVELPAAPAA